MTGEDVLAIGGLILVVVGVIVMIVPMARATLGGSAIGRVPPELSGLTPADQAGLRRTVEENGRVRAQDLPRLRATADGMVARRIGVWFCLGGAIAALGIAVSDPTDPLRLVFCVLILALTGFTARVVIARARAGAAFLATHPR
ncbi:hypothetical protein KIH74_15735 [Kineosporia sp. J2-2]|uniref:SdpI/YhfL protein family protein n=1 Tax=Kineosporia corallincola TaxID=2835133 RepID=A0ABS5TLB5_9ACTN|nr:hypothetical protein [Kineosporia corallincola]MBT0770394.1 hypothetical protein [Kineosporia corallincola]